MLIAMKGFTTMSKWEYCELEWIWHEGMTLATYKTNGTEKRLIAGEDKTREIAKLGEDGWEMIAATATSTDWGSYIFKRPLSKQIQEEDENDRANQPY